MRPRLARPRARRVLLALGALSLVAGLMLPLWSRALLPELAVTRAYYRDARLYGRAEPAVPEDPAAWDPPAADPWGRPWRVVHQEVLAGWGMWYHAYSPGPDGEDDGGGGDDVWPQPHDEHGTLAAPRPPRWPVLHLDLLLLLGAPAACWWLDAAQRLWSAPRQAPHREVALCSLVAAPLALLLGGRLLLAPSPPGAPWLLLDPGLAFAGTGALATLLVFLVLRAWRIGWTLREEEAAAG